MKRFLKNHKKITAIMMFVLMITVIGSVAISANVTMAEDSSSASIIINQVYGDGGKDDTPVSNSFIELYNTTDEDISLDGYTIVYSSQRGSGDGDCADGETYTFSSDAVIEAHSSYLIVCADADATDSAYIIDSSDADATWERVIDNKQYTIGLYYTDGSTTTTIDGICVEGEDNSENNTDGEITTLDAGTISKQRSVIREDLTDTNSTSDFTTVTYEDISDHDLELYHPKSSSDGEWSAYTNVLLNIGATETEMNLSWYSEIDSTASVQVAEADDMTGTDFPSDYTTYEVTTSETSTSGTYVNDTTITDLESNTEYVYRVSNNGVWSDYYYFTTQTLGDDEDFSFIAVGDPQIGASHDEDSDTSGWIETMTTALSNFVNTNFVLSVGDQVESADSEDQYSSFLSLDAFSSVALATSVGNHEASSTSTLYSEHYNLPNVSEYGETTDGSGDGDYYYVYNGTLFLDLNSNNSSVAEHTEFMEEAIADNPDVNWVVVVFHHSIYSVARHASDDNVVTLRTELAPVLYDLDVDVVLMGHDHVYVRSYIMGGDDGLTADVETDSDGSALSSVTDPDGVLYVTLNSASGSKFYDITSSDYEYAAVTDQSYESNYSNVEVTDSSFTITTYNTSGDVVDTFTINKTVEETSTDTDTDTDTSTSTSTDTTSTDTSDSEVTVTSSSDSNATVTGDIPEDSVFTFDQISTDDEIYTEVAEILAGDDYSDFGTFVVYDLDLTSDDVTVEITDDGVVVTMSVPEELEDVDNIAVFVLEDDGTLTQLDCTVEDGVITFTAPHFSTYVFAEDLSGDSTDSATSTVSTGDAENTALYITLLCASSAAVVIYAWKKVYAKKA